MSEMTLDKSAGALTYAIGDIHGRLDLLEKAIALIDEHAAGRARRLVFLGDYVDRGPASRQVVERLIALARDEDAICLKGNHEVLMLAALAGWGGAQMGLWFDNGGEATLASYGFAAEQKSRPILPKDHLAWISRLPLFVVDPHRIYVHAGLRPGVPLRAQKEASLLWIREAFLAAGPGSLPCHIVHGHTPLWSGKPDPAVPELLAQRTNLDTGAVFTGVLSIGVFDPEADGGPFEVLTARGPPRERWYRLSGSNGGPPDPQSGALTN
jgi:serine/threonine protein phosphatase 1